MRTRIQPNPNVLTDATQGLVLSIDGDDRTEIAGTVNGFDVSHRVGELRGGSVSTYLRPYMSPAYRFDPAVPSDGMKASIDIIDTSGEPDWYYLRVRQIGDQWAWSSPVWVDPS